MRKKLTPKHLIVVKLKRTGEEKAYASTTDACAHNSALDYKAIRRHALPYESDDVSITRVDAKEYYKSKNIFL